MSPRLKPSRPVLWFASLWAVAIVFIAVRAFAG
jgi:hypothetical protein